jgi:hypothetical protein
VRIPTALADVSLAAWAREDDEAPAYETAEQRIYRDRAADLALVGLSIEARGRRDGDAVVVDLSADLLVAAIQAADD